MADLIPYLKFTGNCREAMTFYQSCLGGEVNFMTFRGTPMESNVPVQNKDNIMHSILNSGNIMLMGSDMADENPIMGNRLDITLVCTSEDELKMRFEKLSSGGNIIMPLEKMFFGWFGAFTDQYGFRWSLQYSADNKATE